MEIKNKRILKLLTNPSKINTYLILSMLAIVYKTFYYLEVKQWLRKPGL